MISVFKITVGIGQQNDGKTDRQTGTSCGVQVLELCLMLSDGKVMTLTCNDEDKELFQAARLSLGALGVVVSLKLQCEPAFNLRQVTYAAKLDDVCIHFKTCLNTSFVFRVNTSDTYSG